MHPRLVPLLLLLAGSLFPDASLAAVSTASYFRLGEGDPEAGTGQPASQITADSGSGAVNLYRSGTAPAAYGSNTCISGSTLCVALAGGGYINRTPFALSDHWGLEAWVQAEQEIPSLSSDGYATIVFNGDSGANGMGILQTPDGYFKGLCGGVGLVGKTKVVAGAWTHLAIVATGGTATFYANGVAVGSAPGPRVPTGHFGLGVNPGGYGSGEPFQGSLDEVRVFAFAPGQFRTNDLLLGEVPPPAQPPTILSGPTLTPPGAIVSGNSFSLAVLVGGTGPFSFQWRTNGANLSGATNATLAFANATHWNRGSYSVVVGNTHGSVTSSAVNVTIQTLADGLTNAVRFLEIKTREMIRADRYVMPNGIAAFPPQVGSGYDAFWLRDYAYMLEGGVTEFSTNELLEACQVFIKALREDGAGVDCVKYSGQPIYQPGYGSMGNNPVADGSQFTVDVAWRTYQQTQDRDFLRQIISGLVKTMQAAPRHPLTGLIHIKTEGWDRCPYGFTDSVRQQGEILFCSLLYLQACRQLGELLEVVDRSEDALHWRLEADKLAPLIRQTFWDENVGLFRAATKYCGQPDIWGSAFAVWLGVTTPRQAITIATYFRDHYSEIVQAGQIRQLPGGVYWDAACPRDTYQNGGFWATATGWFVFALNLVDQDLASRTIVDLVNDFQNRGVNEWVWNSTLGVNNYLSSVTLPLAGVRRVLSLRTAAPQVVIGPTRSPDWLGSNAVNFSLSLAASGAAPLHFEWRHNGVPLAVAPTALIGFTNFSFAGATLALVSFTNATDAASGIYDVVITNAHGSTTSTVPRVNLGKLPPASVRNLSTQ